MQVIVFNDNLDELQTRESLVETGQQVNLTEKTGELTKEAGFKYQLYCTKAVWEIIETAIANTLGDLNGITWDICWMARFGKAVDGRTREFTVIIRGGEHHPDYIADDVEHYRLRIACGPTDFLDPAPCMTLSRATEH